MGRDEDDVGHGATVRDRGSPPQSVSTFAGEGAARYDVSVLMRWMLVLWVCACSAPAPVLDAGMESPADAGCPPGACVEDPCDAVECPDPRHVCVRATLACECPPGTHAVGDRCEDDTTCTDTTCGPSGVCAIEDGEIACTCGDGAAGERCEDCAPGFLRDPEGRCDANLCDPNPCDDDPMRARCVVEDEVALCRCNAGTHEEDGVCVVDTACTPDTCSMRGACSMDGDDLACACDDGFAGRFCETCADGFHSDGAGGCTTDVCLPDPCTDAPFTRCVEGACECPVGQHREGAGCAVDETCDDATCAGRGMCVVMDGRASCMCDAEYDGARCESCAPGYHDDGMGGCTDDVCLPNPCTTPNRTVCTAGSCGCDPGYHDDGALGCTTDPCLPHPCGSQACRDNGGAAECFTPMCDDANDCTIDTPTAGGCSHAPRLNGSACSTSVCLSGQTCTGGVCGGGSAISCADTNPCTVDSCDAITGCAHTVDPSIVPDDGVACTTGSCASGAPVHTPSDASCDDALYCTGVERCRPTDPARDGRGCVRTDVPLPPGTSTPCASYGACDEATDSFPRITRPMGASCDDHIACTSGDVCQSAGGACAGTVTGSCAPTGSCGSTVPFSSAIDVPTATITGAVTVNGAAPPMTVPGLAYGTAAVWLVAQDTGVRHRIAQLSHTYSSSGNYRLQSGDGAIDARIVPGVYDLLYQRGDNVNSNGSGDRWVDRLPASGLMPNGFRTLREDIVIGAGPSTLAVDIPTAMISGVVTVNGGPPPMTVPGIAYGTAAIWAVSRDTGVRHRIAQLSHTYSSSGSYRLQSGDGTIDAHLVPGTYDILYQRDDTVSSTGSGDRWVDRLPASGLMPNGYRILREGVVIAAGASTLNVDIPTSAISGVVTINGAAPPMTVPGIAYGTAAIWLVSRDTGVRHRIAQLSHTYSSSGNYRLQAGDGAIDAHLVPGTYDVLYQRGDNVNSNGSGDRWVDRLPAAGLMPMGYRVVREGVVIPPGASTFDVDVSSATVSGSVTINGAAPPMTVPGLAYGTAAIWLVSRDTGVRHRIAQLSHTYSSSGNYRLQAGDGTIDAQLVPGTYDVLYQRGDNVNSNGSGDRWVDRLPASGLMPNGFRVVRQNVVIAPGASALDVDVTTSTVSGTITVAGGAPPMTVPGLAYGTAAIWLLSRDTGVRHRIAQLSHTYSSSGNYRLQAGDGTIDAQLVPGTYDVLYQRGDNVNSNGSGDRWVDRLPASGLMPNGFRIIREGLVIGPGASAWTIDIPERALGSSITVDASAPPMTVPGIAYGTAAVWAVSRDTGVRHRLGQLSHTYSSSGNYRLQTGDGIVDARIPPGTYDLLYQRGDTVSSTGSGDRWVDRLPASGLMPNGYRLLRECVALP
jgi:hypothetical protein